MYIGDREPEATRRLHSRAEKEADGTLASRLDMREAGAGWLGVGLENGDSNGLVKAKEHTKNSRVYKQN